MNQYNLNLPENRHGNVVKKETILRPPPLLGLGKRRKIIIYLVVIEPAFQGKDKYRVFKTEKDGKWLKEGDNEITLAIKRAIDEYEIPMGKEAYKELF